MSKRKPFTNDSGLWVAMLSEVSRLFPTAGHEERESQARRFVAIVRRLREPHAQTWAPKDTIPADITAVYDLDGDRWTRRPGGLWRMPDFDEDEHEGAAGEAHTDVSFLRNYGPVTELPKRSREADTSA